MKAPELTSERLILRPLSTEFCSSRYVGWMNDPEVTRYMESGGDYTSEKLEDFLVGVERSEILFWAVLLKDSEKHIGNIKIDPVNMRHLTAEYGIMMGDREEWGKGFATEASRTVINYCFNEVGLRKITLGVVKDNVAAVRTYEKLGFEIEGNLRKQVIYDNGYLDILRMARFNESFKND